MNCLLKCELRRQKKTVSPSPLLLLVSAVLDLLYKNLDQVFYSMHPGFCILGDKQCTLFSTLSVRALIQGWDFYEFNLLNPFKDILNPDKDGRVVNTEPGENNHPWYINRTDSSVTGVSSANITKLCINIFFTDIQ